MDNRSFVNFLFCSKLRLKKLFPLIPSLSTQIDCVFLEYEVVSKNIREI